MRWLTQNKAFLSPNKNVTNLLEETSDLLKKQSKTAHKLTSTPIDPSSDLNDKGESMQVNKYSKEDATIDMGVYQWLVGKVYAISVISQFIHNPKEAHW